MSEGNPFDNLGNCGSHDRPDAVRAIIPLGHLGAWSPSLGVFLVPPTDDRPHSKILAEAIRLLDRVFVDPYSPLKSLTFLSQSATSWAGSAWRRGRGSLIIKSLALRVPSRCVSNNEILDWILEANADLPSSRVSRYCRQLESLLAKAGAETRYLRDREKSETAFHLIMDAVRSALVQADVKPADIDLVIYCGVGRGFLEPANAAFVSRALEIHCDWFDVVDACMSWVRSLHIAYNLLMNGTYSRILVVNGEFTVYEHGLPDVVKIRSEDQLRYTFPALTVGEAATATVLVHSQRQWRFRFRSDPSLATLCTLPLPGYSEFAGPDRRLGLSGVHQLVSFGQELSGAVIKGMIQFVRETYEDLSRVDLWFPHGATESLCHLAASRLGLGDRLYSRVFRHYGNLVSASIPAAMVMALAEGRLARGHKIVLCPAAAGASYALVECEY